MALLESTSRQTRAAAMAPDVTPPKRSARVERPQSRWENIREVGNTMLALMLVAIGIVVLRYLLVIAHGLLH
jgi:hypothetical protein